MPQIEPPQSRILEEFREVQETISPIDIEDSLSTPPITPPPEPEIIEKQIQVSKPEIKIYKPRKPIKKLKPSTPPMDRLFEFFYGFIYAKDNIEVEFRVLGAESILLVCSGFL